MPAPTPQRYGGTAAAATPTRTPHCATHPDALAGWRCPRHGDLCPDCAAERKTGLSALVVCAHCGALAAPITVPRESLPFAARLPGALRYPLSVSGLFALGGLGLVTGFMPGFNVLGLVISLGVYWSYMFALVEQSANGSADIETPDYTSVWDDIFAPAVRGVCATGIIWLPALLLVIFGLGAAVSGDATERASFGVLWVPLAILVLAGVFYAPMAIMIAATRNPFLQVINPYFVVVCARRLGADYAIAVGAIVLLGGAQVVAKLLGSVIERVPVPVLATWLAAMVGLYLPFVMARVLGLLLYVRGADLGYGGPEDQVEPALPGARPRGTPRPVPDLGFGPVAPPAPGTAPAAAARAPAAPPPVAVTPAAAMEVAAALDRGDLVAAQELWRQLDPGAHYDLSPASHVAVGRAAAAARDFHLAILALRAAADTAPDDPEAQRAWVLLARVYADKLGDLPRARQIYGYVVERYPGTDAAAFAQSQLDQPAGDGAGGSPAA